MCFLDVDKNLRRLLSLSEQVFVSVKNLSDHTISRGFVNLRIPARLVNDHKTALPQVLVNIVCEIRLDLIRVLLLNCAEKFGAVGIGPESESFL